MIRISLLTVLIGFLLVSCQNVTPLPYGSYPSNISLNGKWQFQASNENMDATLFDSNYSEWDTLRVPGNWDTRDRYSEYTGKGYYQRQFEIPKEWFGKQIRLKFDAVYQTSKVWLNGALLGEHTGRIYAI